MLTKISAVEEFLVNVFTLVKINGSGKMGRRPLVRKQQLSCGTSSVTALHYLTSFSGAFLNKESTTEILNLLCATDPFKSLGKPTDSFPKKMYLNT